MMKMPGKSFYLQSW